jgi:hypothetical protein
MGLSVACARCHDHKFDPIPTTDYYALAGIFRSTDTLSGVKRGNNKTGYAGDFGHLIAAGEKNETNLEERRKLAQLKRERDEAEKELAAAREQAKERFAAGGDGTKGKGKNKAKNKAAKGLAAAFRKEQQRINELDAQIAELEGRDTASGEPVMAVRDSRRPADVHVNIRGEVTELGPEVPRGYVRVLTFAKSPDVVPSQSGRLQLAMWMTSEQNPLTARVMANRVWFHLFGRGIVETIDNFGALGERPTNPELLDYLAIRFVKNDWSVKKLIREIVLSRAYQLSSDHSDAAYAADPDNKLVWRMNRRRLEAEAIRDALLAVAAQLDLERPRGSLVQTISGGEIGRQARTAGLQQPVKYRSAYLPMVRGLVPEFLNLFDVADAELVVGQRDVTTVAPQALYLMNNPLVVELAGATAERLAAKSDLTSDAARVDYAFRLVLGRPATADEQAATLAYVQGSEASTTAWTSVCQTLFASAEFRYSY